MTAFPLGAPVNRKPEPGFVAIPGRPGWWRHQRTGEEKYVEPPKPPQTPIFYARLSPAVLHAAEAVRRTARARVSQFASHAKK